MNLNAIRPAADAPITPQDIALRPALREPELLDDLAARTGQAWDQTTTARIVENVGLGDAEVDAYGRTGHDQFIEDAAHQEREHSLRSQPHLRGPDPSYMAGNPVPLLTEQQWRESPSYREGITYDPALTPVRAKALAESYDLRMARESIISRSPGGWRSIAGFGLGVGANLLDPINWIPFVGQATRAKAIGKFGQIGGRMLMESADAAIGNTLLNPIIFQDLSTKGAPYELDDYLLDIAMGAGAGALFGIPGGLKARHGMRKLKAAQDAMNVAMLDVAEGKAADVGETVKDAANASTAESPVYRSWLATKPTKFRLRDALEIDMDGKRTRYRRPENKPFYTEQEARINAERLESHGIEAWAEEVRDGEWLIGVGEGRFDNLEQSGRKIEEAVAKALGGEEIDPVFFGGVGSNEAAHIAELTGGLDVWGFRHVLHPDEARHLRKHVPEGANISALSPEELRAIPYVIADPDAIKAGRSSGGKRGKRPIPTIAYRKRLNENTILVVEEVRRGKQQLAVLTAYRVNEPVPGKRDGLPPRRTSETKPGHGNTIEETPQKVNWAYVSDRVLSRVLMGKTLMGELNTDAITAAKRQGIDSQTWKEAAIADVRLDENAPSPARVEFTPDGRAILTIHPDVAPGHAAKVLREAITQRHPQGVPVRPTDVSPARPDPALTPEPLPERPTEPNLDTDDADNRLLVEVRQRQEAGQLHEADALELQTAQRERSRMERWAEGLKAAAACVIRKHS